MRETCRHRVMPLGRAVLILLSLLVPNALSIPVGADNFSRHTNAKSGPTQDAPAPPECDSCPCPPEGEDGTGADDGSDTEAETSNNASGSPATAVAAPVDPYTGRFSVRRTDIAVPGVFPIEFTRSYDSLSRYDSPLGYGWSHNFDMRVYEYPNNEVILRLREGRRLRYLLPAAGNVLTPTQTSCGHTPRLVKGQINGTYVATLQNGNRAFFDIEGRLETLENPQGNRLRFTYGAEMPLSGRSPFALNPSVNLTVARYWPLILIREQLKSQVTGDTFTGRSLTFDYDDTPPNPTGRLTSVTSHDGRQVVYSHQEMTPSDGAAFPGGGVNRGNLATVIGLGGVIEEYRYSNTASAQEFHQVRWMRLGGNTDPVVNTYQADGRIQSQVKGQSQWAFGYVTNAGIQTTAVTRVIVTIPSTPAAITTFEYNPDGFLKRKRDALLNDILYKRDAGPDIDKIEVYNGAAPGTLIRTVDLEYAPGGQLIERKVALAGPPSQTVTETFGYDPQDPEFATSVTVSSTDPDPNVFETHYDYLEAAGRPTNLERIRRTVNSIGPVEEVTTFAYNADGLLEFITPPPVSPADGLQVQRIYYTTAADVADAEGRKRVGLLKKIQLLANPGPATLLHLARTFDYDAQGLVRLVTDARAHETEFEWDARARLIRTTQKIGASSTWETTRYIYGSPNDGAAAIPPEPGDLLLQVEEGAVGPVAAPITAGQIRLFRWNPRGRLVKIERDNGAGMFSTLATFTYDSDGNRLTEQQSFNPGDPRVLTFTYDKMRRLKTIRDEAAPANEIQFGYDVLGNRTSVLDAKLHLTTFQYDELDRLIKTSQTAPNPDLDTFFAYDAAGNVTGVTDPKAQLTKYLYDPLSRLLQVSQELPAAPGTFAATSAYRYDGRGRLDRVTNARLQAMNYSYEPWGGLQKVEHFTTVPQADAGTPILRTVAYGYDVNGNLRSSSDSFLSIAQMPAAGPELVAGRMYTFTYDPLNRVKDVLTSYIPGGVFSTSTYDSVGNKSTLSWVDVAASRTQVWTFDNLNRLTGACMPQDHPCDPGGETLAFTYYENDDLEQITHGNGLVTDLTYEPHGPLDVLLTTGPGTATPLRLDYAYDKNLNVEEILERRSLGGTDHVFDPAYDAVDRILSMAYPSGLGFTPPSETFGYDAAGNQDDNPGTPTPWEYDLRNRIQASPGRSYAFDDDGNLITRTLGGPAIPLTWNVDNRLASYDAGGPDSETYLYDPFGRRVRKTNSAGTTNYLWDGDQLIAEYDGSGNRWVRYAYAGGFAPAQVAFGPSGSEAIYDVHVDHLDTPRMLTDSGGIPRWRASYQAFGTAVVDTNPDGDGDVNNNVAAFNIRFPGQYFDAKTGMHDNRFRTYDPSLGRYISADPIGQIGSLNVYRYARSNPTNEIDPLGLLDFGDEINTAIATSRERDPFVIKERAIERARQEHPGSGQGDQDSFRHCLGSCETARTNGSTAAGLLGNANESLGNFSYNQSKAEEERDKANNAVGIECAEGADSFEDCAASCNEALASGRLMPSPGDGLPGQYNSAFPAGTRYRQRY